MAQNKLRQLGSYVCLQHVVNNLPNKCYRWLFPRYSKFIPVRKIFNNIMIFFNNTSTLKVHFTHFLLNSILLSYHSFFFFEERQNLWLTVSLRLVWHLCSTVRWQQPDKTAPWKAAQKWRIGSRPQTRHVMAEISMLDTETGLDST